MDKQLNCKECGQTRKLGRKLCMKCNSLRVKNSNLKTRGTSRYTYSLQCKACKMMYKAHRKEQKFCTTCWSRRGELAKESISSNAYFGGKIIDGIYRHEHRAIAERIVHRRLQTNEIVHHIDDKPQNNDLSNLIIMDRRSHGKLHLYLDDQRVILEKSGNDNLGNCWNNLIGPMTTAWLETTGAKVIKLSELGQSAAEPFSNGEGSETSAPDTLAGKAEGEDTVQPTTQQCGLRKQE
jgi:hypothetical protein